MTNTSQGVEMEERETKPVPLRSARSVPCSKMLQGFSEANHLIRLRSALLCEERRSRRSRLRATSVRDGHSVCSMPRWPSGLSRAKIVLSLNHHLYSTVRDPKR